MPVSCLQKWYRCSGCQPLYPQNQCPIYPKPCMSLCHQRYLPKAAWPNVAILVLQVLPPQGSRRQTAGRRKSHIWGFSAAITEKIHPQIFSVTDIPKASVTWVFGRQLVTVSWRMGMICRSLSAFSNTGSLGSSTSTPVCPTSQRQNHSVSIIPRTLLDGSLRIRASFLSSRAEARWFFWRGCTVPHFSLATCHTENQTWLFIFTAINWVPLGWWKIIIENKQSWCKKNNQ